MKVTLTTYSTEDYSVLEEIEFKNLDVPSKRHQDLYFDHVKSMYKKFGNNIETQEKLSEDE